MIMYTQEAIIPPLAYPNYCSIKHSVCVFFFDEFQLTIIRHEDTHTTNEIEAFNRTFHLCCFLGYC